MSAISSQAIDMTNGSTTESFHGLSRSIAEQHVRRQHAIAAMRSHAAWIRFQNAACVYL